MKIIGRILIILAAALVVVGITMAIGNSSGAAQAAPPRPDGQQFQPGGDDNFVPGQRPDGNFEEREEGRGFSFGWVKDLAVITVIVVLFLAGERLWDILRRQRISLTKTK
jgi:hypothetical protein